MAYGVNYDGDESLLDRIAEAVQDQWPGVTSGELGFATDNEGAALAMVIGAPIFALLVNQNNGEHAALAVRADDSINVAPLTDDTLDEGWSAFTEAELERFGSSESVAI